ncbi:Filamentous haemagglutinin-like [Calothrix sp. PCC 7716]|nr:Filamentous haemagglutinin-like [Calothrix sp. PCC 7716]
MLLSQFKRCFIGITIICCFTNNAVAQIKPDTTLPVNTNVTKLQNMSVISGGTQAGSNLFHSFEEFSIASGETVYFANSTNIQNIISRVTGFAVSNINGIIRTSDTANLFLINPNGIIFGTNASLNIGGSFLASTASSINFSDNTIYSATLPFSNPLLTVTAPTGLQFGTTATQIRVTSQAKEDSVTNSLGAPVGLRVPDGKTLSLIGGDVVLEGGNLTAPGGRIELISVAGNSSVNLNPTSQVWILDKTEAQYSQDIKLFERNVDGKGISSIVDTGSNNGSGSIYVLGRIVELRGNLVSLGAINQGSTDGQGITINAIKLIVSDGAQIYTYTLGTGAAGDIQANVRESVELSDKSKFFLNDNILSTVLYSTTAGSGRAGNITINTKNLSIQGARITTQSEGIISASNEYIPATGAGGNLTINALNSVEIIGKTDNPYIGLFAGTQSPGNYGDLKLTTGTLTVRSGGAVTVSSKIPTGVTYVGDTSKLGTAGNLDVTARNIILDTNAKITSETDLGRGGNINLLVRDLLLMRRGSQISTSAGKLNSAGDGGNITINIPTGFIVAPPQENNDITANAFSGSGGKVQVNAISLFGTAPRSREDLVRKLKINNGTNPSVLDPDSLPTSDITAISQENPTLNGIVNINTLDDSINRTPINLPTQLVEQKLSQSCRTDVLRNQSQFVITGRGGLPTTPLEPIRSNTTIKPDWVSVERGDSESRQDFLHYAPGKINIDSSRDPMKVVEAIGWVRSSKGDLYLVANTPFTKTNTPRFQSVSCRRD